MGTAARVRGTARWPQYRVAPWAGGAPGADQRGLERVLRGLDQALQAFAESMGRREVAMEQLERAVYFIAGQVELAQHQRLRGESKVSTVECLAAALEHPRQGGADAGGKPRSRASGLRGKKAPKCSQASGLAAAAAGSASEGQGPAGGGASGAAAAAVAGGGAAAPAAPSSASTAARAAAGEAAEPGRRRHRAAEAAVAAAAEEVLRGRRLLQEAMQRQGSSAASRGRQTCGVPLRPPGQWDPQARASVAWQDEALQSLREISALLARAAGGEVRGQGALGLPEQGA